MTNSYFFGMGMFALAVILLLGAVVYVVGQFATYSVYGGRLTSEAWDNSTALCGDDLMLGRSASCNHINVYCERFWWPIQCYNECGASEDYHVCAIKAIGWKHKVRK